jgi:hypothetical protein
VSTRLKAARVSSTRVWGLSRVGGYLGADGEDDRAELFDGLGRASRGRGVVCVAGGGDRLEQFLLSGENDFLLVAEVAEET